MKERLTKIRKKLGRFYVLWKNFCKNPDLLGKFQMYIFDRTHKQILLGSPTEREKQLIENLRKEVRALPLENVGISTSDAERKWIGFKNALREKILHGDPRDFLSWEVIQSTMGGTLHHKSYQELIHFSFWKEWGDMIEKIPLINEKPYFKNPKINGTILAHAKNLAQIKQQFNEDVADLHYIVEFGADYGGMYTVINALGFKGIYIMFDWPEFLLLQEFYLKQHEIDTSNVRFVSNFSDLQKILDTIPTNEKSLLIATWSLSEVSENLRNKFFSLFKAFSYLIAYQKAFGEVDNHAYFRKFIQGYPDIEWRDYPIANLPGEKNRYLIGLKKSVRQ